MVRLTFFGRLTDLTDSAPREIDLPPGVGDVAALRAWLSDKDAHLADALAAPGVRAVVDDAIVADTHRISQAREIGFIPPVSGG